MISHFSAPKLFTRVHRISCTRTSFAFEWINGRFAPNKFQWSSHTNHQCFHKNTLIKCLCCVRLSQMRPCLGWWNAHKILQNRFSFQKWPKIHNNKWNSTKLCARVRHEPFMIRARACKSIYVAISCCTGCTTFWWQTKKIQPNSVCISISIARRTKAESQSIRCDQSTIFCIKLISAFQWDVSNDDKNDEKIRKKWCWPLPSTRNTSCDRKISFSLCIHLQSMAKPFY